MRYLAVEPAGGVVHRAVGRRGGVWRGSRISHVTAHVEADAAATATATSATSATSTTSNSDNIVIAPVHPPNAKKTFSILPRRGSVSGHVMTYVGQTKRRLKTRLKEHRDGWKRINNTSVVSKHQVNCNHDIDWDNTAILDNEPIYFKRSISEMIHIKNQTNSLNLQSDTEKLPQMYYSIITNTHQESNVNPLS
ncbi:hypothetical protein ALC62_13294 [Cyphomyrmex costatus]|uniref:GIY-YIG domain-containing protein n=1 Tax=Cyphomyrmex costatus TaxID=456900 RepID=A0A151IA70_9HYME|nr:hypothetical protein ALC62_13294 [Cyphomyrmex costatus]